jgi:hypothetical protein
MDQKNHKTYKSPDLPTASFEIQRAYSRAYGTLSIFQTIFQATKGVFKPGPNDPKTWYGRAFRFIGLIFLYFFIAMLIFVAVQDFLKGIR